MFMMKISLTFSSKSVILMVESRYGEELFEASASSPSGEKSSPFFALIEYKSKVLISVTSVVLYYY